MAETILVVDDEAQIRNTLRGVLSDEGFDVLEAENGRRRARGARAPQAAPRDRRHLDAGGRRHRAGRSACARRRPRVPIIVISGHGTIETAVRVIRDGAFDFLEKPFPLDALLRVVGRALDERMPDRQAEPIGGTTAAPDAMPARRLPQRTIGRSMVVNGQGLHSGVRTGSDPPAVARGERHRLREHRQRRDRAGAHRSRRRRPATPPRWCAAAWSPRPSST